MTWNFRYEHSAASICTSTYQQQRCSFQRKPAKRLWFRLASGVLVIVINWAASTWVLQLTHISPQNGLLPSLLFPPATMILNQISYLDCVAFLVFLVPHLLIQVGLIPLLKWLVPALPYIGMFLYIMLPMYWCWKPMKSWSFHISLSASDTCSHISNVAPLWRKRRLFKISSSDAFAMHSRICQPS